MVEFKHKSVQDEELAALSGIGATSLKVGTHTVTSGEASANTLSIDTGVTIAGVLVFITTSAGVGKSKPKVTSSSTTLIVADNASDFDLQQNDIINYIVWAS